MISPPVQRAFTSANATSKATTLDAPSGAANGTALLAIITTKQATGVTQETVNRVASVTDNAGNAYTCLGWHLDPLTRTADEFWIALAAAPASVVTAALVGVAAPLGLGVSEWSGVATASALDGVPATQNNSSAATTTPLPAQVTTTVAGAVVIGVISTGATANTLTHAVADGFTLLCPDGGENVVTNAKRASAYRIPGATGTYGPTWTTPNVTSTAMTVALKPYVAPTPESAGRKHAIGGAWTHKPRKRAISGAWV